MTRPLLLLASLLALGCGVGESLGPRVAALLLGLAGFELALSLRAPRRAALAALLAAALALGAAAAAVERAGYDSAGVLRWLDAEPDAEEPVLLQGIAVEDAREAGPAVPG